MPCTLPPSTLRILGRSLLVSRLPNYHHANRYVSTRARNLAARHWELVRAHSPHPAAQHVVDHEATKARILDYTGLKATTDVIPSASSLVVPKEVVIRGVRIPQRPKPPESDECCMSGCAVCVYDLYLSSLDDYKHDLASARAQLRERSVPLSEWPEEARQAEEKERAREQEATEDPLDSLDLDPSMKAFLILEKKLGQKK